MSSSTETTFNAPAVDPATLLKALDVLRQLVLESDGINSDAESAPSTEEQILVIKTLKNLVIESFECPAEVIEPSDEE